jgi:hypothetical protein
MLLINHSATGGNIFFLVTLNILGGRPSLMKTFYHGKLLFTMVKLTFYHGEMVFLHSNTLYIFCHIECIFTALFTIVKV